MLRINRSTKLLIIFFIAAIMLVVTTVAALHFLSVRHLKESHKQQINILKTELQENTKTVYIPQKDIKRGEMIKESMFIKMEILTKLEDSYITEADFNNVALVDIISGTPVYKNMVAPFVENDLREEEFNVFYLNTNLKNGDYVDIRILYPTGENYIVLSKKAIKNLSLENNDCFLWLTAEEIHYISSAIVDAYLNEGTKLYTSKYIEPSIQEKSISTYMPTKAAIELIERDPNIINVAKANLNILLREELNNRLISFYQSYNGRIQWEASKQPLNEEQLNTEEEVEKEAEEYYYVE